jgi:3-methyl-2-oxobutanoate hydroxymethyltransferase
MSPTLAVRCSRGFLVNYARSTPLDAVRPLLASQLLRTHGRHSSHSPMGSSASNRKKVTLNSLRSLYRAGEPITMITAHDFPSGYVGDSAGMEVILVGDSLAMVALGMEDTSEVLVDEMLLHCRSVARAAKSAFTVSVITPHTVPKPH